MRSLRFVLLISCLAACRDSGPANGAVRVFVTYLSYTPECIRVTASDGQGHSGETDIPRSAFKTPEAKEINVAVFRKPEWAQALNVEVASFTASSGDGCSGTVLERHSSPEPIAITPGEVAEHEVKLEARDDDGDGHVLKTASVAGTDCVDSNRDIHPGAAEVCSGTEDFDCDGLTRCADSDCLGKACDDSDPCTENDRCTPGSGSEARCQGSPKQCTPPNLTCYTTESACDPVTGNCMYTQRPANTTCNDNNPCTDNDQCGMDAACRGTSAIPCNSPPGQCYESAGTCRVADGQCDYPFKATTASCNDSDACTTDDKCNGSGGCAGAPLPPCTASDMCHKSERLGCPASAACTDSVNAAKVNTPCNIPPRSGVCRLEDGACSRFPYLPSNFDPDAIAATGTGPGTDLHVTCGTLANPIVCDTGVPSCTPPAGCTFPDLTDVRIITQGGIETLLLPVRDFIMDPGTAVKLKGPRPLIVAVYGSATIHGALLADADMEVPGAGGNRAACGASQKGGDGPFSSGEGGGGGGGGFGTPGGAGANNNAGATGGRSGGTLSSTLAPLVGGCQGGLGGGNGSGGLGGGGGGALQLSVAGTLRVDGTLSVSGGGARGGSPTNSGGANNEGGGGGGGSGGGLLLEAFRLELATGARLTANGGSGAEGGDAQNRRGSDGTDGHQDVKDPATNPDNGGNGGPGGRGAAEGVSAASGGGAPNDAGAGGGGGGVGVIRLKGFGGCAIDASCGTSDNTGCDLSPKVTPICPP